MDFYMLHCTQELTKQVPLFTVYHFIMSYIYISSLKFMEANSHTGTFMLEIVMKDWG